MVGFRFLHLHELRNYICFINGRDIQFLKCAITPVRVGKTHWSDHLTGGGGGGGKKWNIFKKK